MAAGACLHSIGDTGPTVDSDDIHPLISDFRVFAVGSEAVVQWRDVAWFPVVGYRLERLGDPAGLYSPVNERLLPAVSVDADGITPLVERRANQGLLSRTVMLQDIYDDFNHGIENPWAIRSFLAFAANSWAVSPRYVLLVGEGSYDYKDNKGNGDCIVPSVVVAASERLYGCDNPLADTDTNGAPNIAIGRLPVMTTNELAGIIDKIVAYENGGIWKNRVLMLADVQDLEHSLDFHGDSDDVGSLISTNYSSTNIYAEAGQAPNARSRMLAELNRGVAFMNYLGHATQSQLGANPGLLRQSDLASLTNETMPAAMFTLTCLFGRYAVPGADYMTEELMVKEDGGAVATWAPAPLCYESMNKSLEEKLFTRIFTEEEERLGDAVRISLNQYNDGVGSHKEIVNMIVLQGDPAMLVGEHPTYVLINSFTATERDGEVVVQWETAWGMDTVGFYLERENSNGVYRAVNEALLPAFQFPDGKYELADSEAAPGETYTYKLVEVDVCGDSNTYGPYTVTVDGAGHSFEEWLSANFTPEELSDPAISAPEADHDGDGHSNLQEFYAGTNPRDASSVLNILRTRLVGDSHVIYWLSTSNATYTIENSTSPSEGFIPFVRGIPATPPVNAHTSPVAGGTAFYRIRIE